MHEQTVVVIFYCVCIQAGEHIAAVTWYSCMRTTRICWWIIWCRQVVIGGGVDPRPPVDCTVTGHCLHTPLLVFSHQDSLQSSCTLIDLQAPGYVRRWREQDTWEKRFMVSLRWGHLYPLPLILSTWRVQVMPFWGPGVDPQHIQFVTVGELSMVKKQSSPRSECDPVNCCWKCSSQVLCQSVQQVCWQWHAGLTYCHSYWIILQQFSSMKRPRKCYLCVSVSIRKSYGI